MKPTLWLPATLCLIIGLCVAHASAATGQSIDKMLEASASSQHNPFYLTTEAKFGTEVGPAGAVELLRRLSVEAKEEHRRSLAEAMAHAGGDQALEALRKEPLSKYAWAKDLLFFAAPSAPSAQTIQLMLEALKVESPRYGGDWSQKVQLALSLGLMNATNAVPLLERKASGSGNAFEASAAKAALSWIKESPPEPVFRTASKDDDLLSAILRFYPPDPDPRFRRLCDGNRAWLRTSDRWDIGAGCADTIKRKVNLETFRSSDGQRALVAVNVIGEGGYNYLLRQRGGAWEVTGVRLTWVS